MRQRLSWTAVTGGYHEDASKTYQIYQHEGSWVLSGKTSLVRQFRTLGAAKEAAEIQEESRYRGKCDRLAISQGQIVRSKHGWVIICQPQHGAWREVAGPFSTREQARLLRDIS